MHYYVFKQDTSNEMLADIDALLSLNQFQYMVPNTTVTHVADALILYGKVTIPVFSIVSLATPPCHVIKLVSSDSGFARMDSEVCNELPFHTVSNNPNSFAGNFLISVSTPIEG